MSDSDSTFKDAALRAVGRTVVNFQRLEHNLKRAAHLAPLEGVLAKVEKDLVRLNEKAASMTLGQSISAWLDAIKGGGTSTNPTPDLFDPTIRLTFSFEGFDPDGIHSATLKRLLERRNGLIHDELVSFDWESQAECARLMQDLTNVNEEIRAQIDFFEAILRSSKDALSETVKDGVAEREGAGG
jgi:hypothetical protein